MVIKEQSILKAIRNAGVEHEVNETTIRAAIEREGIDFGRSVHCRGDAPNREWTNLPSEFEPSEEERAVELERRIAEAKAEHEAKIEEEVQRTLLTRENEALKAQLAALSGQGKKNVAPPVIGQ